MASLRLVTKQIYNKIQRISYKDSKSTEVASEWTQVGPSRPKYRHKYSGSDCIAVYAIFTSSLNSGDRIIAVAVASGDKVTASSSTLLCTHSREQKIQNRRIAVYGGVYVCY